MKRWTRMYIPKKGRPQQSFSHKLDLWFPDDVTICFNAIRFAQTTQSVGMWAQISFSNLFEFANHLNCPTVYTVGALDGPGFESR